MSNITTTQNNALAISEGELMGVLRNSLYPGAKDESIKMVIGYCKASGLDPMQKPVHIVPMWDSKARCMRDVIMPGIGSYRTQAARSGEYAGISEPEFGEDVTETFPEESYYNRDSKENKKRGSVSFTFPAWCRVVILDHWEMCSNRNLDLRPLCLELILDHWEMCSNRNCSVAFLALDIILDHWEMCSNRNSKIALYGISGILDHWEMCSNRNHPKVRLHPCQILDHWEMCSNRNDTRALPSGVLF